MRDSGSSETLPPVPHPDRDEPDAEEPPSGVALPVVLFLTTVFTTLWAGAYQTRTNYRQGAWEFLVEDPSVLLKGIPFAATLLAILLTHELGHYILSRIHRVPASLPLFIPGPAHFIGTFGAIIRMRGPILERKALFDIGVAGPIAGFVVAVVALVVGLSLSTVVPRVEMHGPQLELGASAIVYFFASWIFDAVPLGYVISFHPIADAAWFGLFITALNLIPIGQLDGGHVAYALWGERQRTIALSMFPVLLILGSIPHGWWGWYFWAMLGGIMGLSHPPVADSQSVLGRTRVWVGWCALAIFLLTFPPIPFSIK